MATNDNSNEFLKGLVIGSIIGGSVGALIALLYAPKPGSELRKQLAEKTTDIYSKASDYFADSATVVQDTAQNIMNEGREKAQAIVDSARRQAEGLIHKAEDLLSGAKEKASQVQSGVKAGMDAFKNEIK